MIKNYFKTAWRNLRQNKLLSVVNIAGLGIGLACVMLIVLFVNDEYSFDTFHTNSSRIVRVVQTDVDTTGGERRSGNTGFPQGPAFAADIPEVENYCRIKGWDMLTKKGGEGIESKVLFADTSFFSFFSFKVVNGNPQTMLLGTSSVVLTDATAAKYFGNEDPIGKTVEIEVEEDFEPFTVTGIVKAAPANSSIRFDMLLPFEKQLPVNPEQRAEQLQSWNNLFLNTFLLLKKNTTVAAAQSKVWASFLKNNGEGWAQTKAANGLVARTYTLQPFLSMHLDNRFFASNGLSGWSDSKYSYILSGLAMLILLIACINFINIMLAKSLQRSKEIGIRKVSGSSRRQLIAQFLAESFLVTLLSFVPAFLLLQLLLPVFSSFTARHYDISYLFQPSIVFLYGALLLVVSLLAGFYPAIVASGFKPVQTLYGNVKVTGKNILGKSLLVLQFTIAAVLIICTIVFNRQFNYMTKSDVGFSKENIIRLQFPWTKTATQLQTFKNELSKNPAIAAVGGKSGDWNKTVFTINGRKTDWTYYENIDDKYLQVLQIPLVKGRYLSYANAADTISNCLVNEAFVATYLDKTKDPLGQGIAYGSKDGVPNLFVAGVVKNYHSASFKDKIEPICFLLDYRNDALNTFIKYHPGQSKAAVAAIQQTYKSLLPFSVLDLQFMQDWNESWYAEEARWKRIVFYAAIIAILLSCLGLFALSTLSVQQRVKEIGIRKVLGASVSGIAALVSKDFLKLVLIALLIASPLAWWIMHSWLNGFAYRIAVSWWMFLLTALIAILIAVAAVSFHAVKAAVANPVKSLRTE
jgi:putative ABC transport system permease protein